MHKNAKTKLLNLFILPKKNGIKKEKKFFSGKLTKRKYYAMMCLTIKNVSAGGKRRNGEKREGGTFV